MDETAQQLHDERADFLAVMNHRLRTPIIANERVVSLMLNGDFGELQPKQKEILLHMQENNRELDRLILMLTSLYQYKNGIKSLNVAKHQLGEILQSALARVSGFAKSRNARLTSSVDAEAELNCDAEEIATLVAHLLENAIKYGHGHVELNAHVSETNHAVIQVRVDDDGEGIPSQDIPTLFDRFFVNSADGKYAAATGTGLCLCSEIAKAHGGAIQCFSAPGEGTTFMVSLPVHEQTVGADLPVRPRRNESEE